MQNTYGQHGWKEFYRNRKDILTEYDKILEQNENRPVKVAHGIGVEAYLRKLLSEFLPKKFGVTSGYIIPDLYTEVKLLYHYDIIIYDVLESPVLWTEGNQDDSEQGKYRAIPAKHVIALYEVKSRLTKANVKNVIEKLNQIQDFSDQLHTNYSCGIILVELKIADVNKEAILKQLLKLSEVYKCSGGMILRYEGDESLTGKIDLLDYEGLGLENNHLIPLAKPFEDLDIYIDEEGNCTIAEKGAGWRLVQTTKNTYHMSFSYGVTYTEINSNSVRLSWSRNNFSEFCIDLLSSLEGLAYNDEKRPSFGKSFDLLKRKLAPLQNAIQEENKPFLKIKVLEGDEQESNIKIIRDEGGNKLSFTLLVENWGEVQVVISSDGFKTKFNLLPKTVASTNMLFEIEVEDAGRNILETLEKNGFFIPYRLVYYEEGSTKEFYAIEKNIILNKGKLSLT